MAGQRAGAAAPDRAGGGDGEGLLLEENRKHATKIEEALRLRRSYRHVHDAVDRWLLPKVLDESKGIIVRVAKQLGMDPKTLRNRLQRLGVYELTEGEGG